MPARIRKFRDYKRYKMKKQPKVAIIIATFNQEKLLFKNLETLKKRTGYKNYKVYLVDDSGNGKIGKLVQEKFKFVDVTINKENIGFSRSNNIGIKKAINNYNPDYFLLLNDDTEVIQRNWLNKMIEVGERNEKIGILGCKLVYPGGNLQNIGGYIRKWEIVKELEDREDIFEVDHVMGAFMMIKRAVIERIGLLNEIYSPYLLEDTDYCLSAKKNGFKVVSVGNVKIIHNKGKSIDSQKDKKMLVVRFKNDIIFSLRNLGVTNALFRIFVYLPLVAIFKKKDDEAELKFRNFVLRKDFLINLGIYLFSLINSPIKYLLKK
ncbi:hypothetical protein A3K62_01190 [Candidatus Pacearchaeota archaeon RBG_16_35_8]|nr:MAG: hypothetical protein A3K62_01190 [Candidatus Pacearchaeota archaeon RBG_16_35_8]